MDALEPRHRNGRLGHEKMFRTVCAEHAWDEPKESLSRFQAVESRLRTGCRSYLYSNQNSVGGYAAKLFDGRREYQQHTSNRQ